MRLPSLTIFLGAFLLFLVQPLIGKFILPWFGGGPGVWTTCLLFFQSLLLGGYAYAHWLATRVPLRRQAVIHLSLLALSLLFLPLNPDLRWKPTGAEEPVLHILLLLAATVGLPYLVLSATGPLVQRWFSLSHPGTSPYRLYALSNAGSLLALLCFPFVLEPLASRATLAWGWSGGLLVFATLCGTLAWRTRGLAAASPGGLPSLRAEDAPSPDASASAPDPIPPTPNLADLRSPDSGLRLSSLNDRLLWVTFPGLASLLLVAVTNKICLDIAAVPFLWVLPLTVYLLSFILCFDHPRWYSRRVWSALLVAGCGATARCLHDATIPLPVQAGVYVATLLAACMVCHGELHRLRPPAAQLTGFYLTIAAGGAGGSIFVALVAPLLFADYREFQLGLVLLLYFTGIVCLLSRSRSLATGPAIGALAVTLLIPALQATTGRGFAAWFNSWALESFLFYRDNALAIGAGLVVIVVALRREWRVNPGEWRRRLSAVPLLLAVLLGAIFVMQAKKDGTDVFAAARNFYGAYKVHLYNENDLLGRCFLLSHGGITHGLQFSHSEYAGWATSYYGATSGVGRALDSIPGTRRVGLVGLGVGTLAAYGRPDDVFRFYEIDAAMVDVARTHFSYLRHTPATVEIALGDARLTLEDELRRTGSQQFDLLILDAFSGDAIPVHLLTRETMALYRAHLKPDGLLAVHISNRHLDLRPVVEGLAQHHGLHIVNISDTVEKKDWWIYDTSWMLLSADPARLAVDDIRQAAEEPPDESAEYVHWTDDHASLFSIIK